jgi:hypothetical protein
LNKEDILNVETKAKLKIFGKLDNLYIDLYLPLEIWKKLVKTLNGNRLNDVVLRFEGEDNTKIDE